MTVNTVILLFIQCKDPEKWQASALRYQAFFNASKRGHKFT